MSARTVNTKKYIQLNILMAIQLENIKIIVLYLFHSLDDVFFSKWLTKEILDVSYYDWSAYFRDIFHKEEKNIRNIANK